MSKQPDGSFVLTEAEYRKLRELFRWRGHPTPVVSRVVQELCSLIETRTGMEYEQYT